MDFNLVQEKNEKLVTTSLLIAEKFNKHHNHILRDIETLIEQLNGVTTFGHTPYIERAEYLNEQNQQFYPMYYLDRDAFVLLVMGFNNTNPLVLEWKLKFINAFNQMEQQLHALTETSQLPSYEERARVAKYIIRASRYQIQAIKELYPEFFQAPATTLELRADLNDSYTSWIQDYNIDIAYLTEFPTTDLFDRYQRYCTDHRYKHTLGKKQFFKTIGDDFHLSKKQLSDGKRYFCA